MPNRGEELARRSLIQNARVIKKVGASTLPAIATVASVEGDTVTVRVSGAEDAEVEQIGFLSATVNVGDRGIILPIKDGGRVFARSGSALTSDDLPVAGATPQSLTTKLNSLDTTDATKASTTDLNNEITGIGKPTTHDTFTFQGVSGILTTRAGEVGATWTQSAGAGNFAIQNGRIYGTAVGVLYASGIPESADYHVEAEYTYFNDTGDNGIGIRVQPGAHTGYFLYFNYGAFRLYRMVNGAITNLGSVAYGSSSLPVIAGITITGSKIQVIINGTVRLTVTDTAIAAAGRAGLRSSTVTATTGVHLDRFYAARTSVVTTTQLPTHLVGKVDNNQLATNLAGVIANKLEPGTPQSNIANLVPNLADKAPTTYVNSEIRLKTPSARILGSNDVTTSTTASGIGSFDLAQPLETMIFSVGAYQEWRVDAYLECNTSHDSVNNVFNGAQFGVAIPTGATLVGTVVGYRSSTQQWFPFRWTSSGLNPIWWLPNQSSGRIEIHATVKTGGTTGFCVVQKAVVQAGDTLTVLSGSWADAQRIINTD